MTALDDSVKHDVVSSGRHHHDRSTMTTTRASRTGGSTDFAAWVEKCPLRTWRRDTDTSILETATRLRVSMTAIQLWERGVHVPTADHMARLTDLTGRDTLAADWNAWKEAQPA